MASFSWMTSSIGKKLFSALTGLFLCLFLVGHLAGNLPLVFGHLMGGSITEVQTSFNEYAKFMTTFPAVKLLSYATYISILGHAILGLYLVFKNKGARKQKYASNKPSVNSAWASRNMGLLGTLVLAFIIIHMSNFWFKMHYGDLPLDANGLKDIFSTLWFTFKNPIVVVIYAICMAAIGFHLVHGFKSGFQTLGLNHPKYSPIIDKLGKGFAIVVPILFALIPIYVLLFYPEYPA